MRQRTNALSLLTQSYTNTQAAANNRQLSDDLL